MNTFMFCLLVASIGSGLGMFGAGIWMAYHYIKTDPYRNQPRPKPWSIPRVCIIGYFTASINVSISEFFWELNDWFPPAWLFLSLLAAGAYAGYLLATNYLISKIEKRPPTKG